ncbi:HeLo domain-containing protein [Fusarium falciforme]|uniref:HeLo domain-containing protein n=1 Tax=Fusarium falciforme TaxID=195108 RepID=UPI0023004010|nr:HeLo domain-containing protein [Fusarium falciforme]WAO93445.1 HeLo domain-containing protein [Fusarium falciforme]
MADVVSSVTSLFSTALQAFEFIQVARTFENEAGIYQSKLAIIQLRLSRWGEAIGLDPDHEAKPAEATLKNGQPSLAINTDAEAVEEILDNINRALKNAKRESANWKPTGDGMGLDDDDDDLQPRYKRLKTKIRDIVAKRCRQITTGARGAKWALYKKEQCEALTTQLLELIEQLENTVQSEGKLDELSQSESKVLGENLKTLLEAVGDVDPLLKAAASETLRDKAETNNITIGATTNYGLQMGINRGEMKGLTFGTGNTVSHQWHGPSHPHQG